jgi:hypothetical protein
MHKSSKPNKNRILALLIAKMMKNNSNMQLTIKAAMLFLSLMISSCTSDFFNKTIELDDTDYEKKIVVKCFYAQGDQILNAFVSRNYGLNEQVVDSQFFLPNATLELSEGSLTLSSFVYQGDDEFEALTLPILEGGKTYTLKINAPGLPTLTATQTMPLPIQIDTIEYIADGGINQFGDDLSRTEISFRDPAGISNFYAINITSEFFYVNTITDPNGNITYDTTFYTNSNYPEGPLDPSSKNGIQGTLLVSDQLFDGQAYQLKINTYSLGASSPDKKIKVRFRHITEDEYRYQITEKRRRDNEDLPLSEPVIVYENVVNGIGNFGLSWAKEIIIE